MKKIPLILFVLSLILVLSILFVVFSFPPKTFAKTETSGDLQITYEEPLFPSSIIWYPSLSVTKSFTVKNLSSSTYTVFIEATNTSQSGNIAEVFFFKVTEGKEIRYGTSNSKTLKNFWNEGQISLSELNGGKTTTYNLTITMNSSAGNEYQGKQAKFDLIIGFLETSSQVIISGTDNNYQQFSNQPSITSSGKFITNIPSGFTSGFLGRTNSKNQLITTPTKSLAVTKQGKVKGEKIALKSQNYRLLVILLGIVFLLIYYFLFLKRKNKNRKFQN